MGTSSGQSIASFAIVVLAVMSWPGLAAASVYSYTNSDWSGYQYLSTFDSSTNVTSVVRDSHLWNGQPAWRTAVSPDGLTIAWADYYGVHVAPTGGGSTQTIMPTPTGWRPFDLSYSADGGSLLVTMQTGNSNDIVSVSIDGGSWSTIVDGSGDEFDASSSADGAQLSYIEDATQYGEPGTWELWDRGRWGVTSFRGRYGFREPGCSS